MLRYFLPFLLALSCTSCATIFNARTENIKIRTSEPSQLVYQRDTITEISYEKTLHVPRSPEALELRVISDKDEEVYFEVKSGDSFAFWGLNSYFNYGLGMLVDMKNPKRYSYPKHVYVDFETGEFFPFFPIDSWDISRKNVIKFNPFRLAGPIHPGFEFSYERFHSFKHSSQLSLAFMANAEGATNFDYAGYRVGWEERFYITSMSRFRPFVGMEIDFVNKVYDSEWIFGIENWHLDTLNNNYTDAYKVHKKLLTFTPKFGMQFFFAQTITLDFSAGLGIRRRNVSHSERINPNDLMEIPRHPDLRYDANKPGNEWVAALPIQIRVGYAF